DVAVDLARTRVAGDRIKRHRASDANHGTIGEGTRSTGRQGPDVADVVGREGETLLGGLDHEVLKWHTAERDVRIANEGVSSRVDLVIAQGAREGNRVILARRAAGYTGLRESKTAGGRE